MTKLSTRIFGPQTGHKSGNTDLLVAAMAPMAIELTLAVRAELQARIDI